MACNILVTFMLIIELKFAITKEPQNRSFAKKWNFGQNSRIWSNIEMLAKNRNLGYKSKYSSKVKRSFFVKNRNLDKKK